MLDRREAVRLILQDRTNELVVSGLGSPSYDVHAAGDTDRNFYLWGAMGAASMVGLGLALAQPSLPVVVITGDGELAMSLNSLATIGVAAVPNLTVVVIDNEHFGETGMQPSHTGAGLDLAGVASACGFPVVESVEETHALVETVRRFPDNAGPRFLHVRVKPDRQGRSVPHRDAVYLKNRFRAELGHRPN